MIDTNAGDDPKLNRGVFVLRDRENASVDMAKHDVIHCYQPEGDPFTVEDNGYAEQRVVESVQIDIELTDRTDPDTGERLIARDRMVGERSGVATLGDPPYPGILGETLYILETVRRGFEEYDTVSYNPIRVLLNNSNADVSLSVELEQIATNTVV